MSDKEKIRLIYDKNVQYYIDPANYEIYLDTNLEDESVSRGSGVWAIIPFLGGVTATLFETLFKRNIVTTNNEIFVSVFIVLGIFTLVILSSIFINLIEFNKLKKINSSGQLARAKLGRKYEEDLIERSIASLRKGTIIHSLAFVFSIITIIGFIIYPNIIWLLLYIACMLYDLLLLSMCVQIYKRRKMLRRYQKERKTAI